MLFRSTDLLIRTEVTQTNYGNVFLLVVGGPIVGYMCASLQRMSLERDRAERAAAAATERARLARAVHDGVLQVLAMVQRRGGELGGEAADLGRLAGEQEAVLRTLVREQDAVPLDPTAGLDLGVALAGLGSRPGVTVATPATSVVVPAASGASCTTAWTAWPRSGWGMPNTAASRTDGWVSRVSSISWGEMFTPPEMIMWSTRSVR